MDKIPVIDLSKIRSAGEEADISKNQDWLEVAKEIRLGLGGIGFLYLVNHGIPEKTIQNAFEQSRKFFGLPEEVKLKFKKDVTSAGGSNGTFDLSKYSGYMPVGGETLNQYAKYEMKETYDWVNKKYSLPSKDEVVKLHDSIVELDIESKKLYRKLFKLIALSLNLNTNFFINACRHFDDEENHVGIENIRFLHYPAIPEKEEAKPGTVRCGEHSDYGFLTMLFQDDVGGLEVKNVKDEWVEAKPIADSVLINTGDMMEFWTSGIYPATKHRIRIPDVDDERRKKDRYSIAAFNGPDCNALITPMELEQSTEEQERLSKNKRVYEKMPISAYDYMMNLIAKQYQPKI